MACRQANGIALTGQASRHAFSVRDRNDRPVHRLAPVSLRAQLRANFWLKGAGSSKQQGDYRRPIRGPLRPI